MVEVGLGVESHAPEGQGPANQIGMAVAEPAHGEQVPVVLEALVHHEAAPVPDLEPVLIPHRQAEDGHFRSRVHKLHRVHLLEKGHRVQPTLQRAEVEVGRTGVQHVHLGTGCSAQGQDRAGGVQNGGVGPPCLSPFRRQLHRPELGMGGQPLHEQANRHQNQGNAFHLRGRFWRKPAGPIPCAGLALP